MLVDIHKNKDLRNIEVNNIGICYYKLPIIFKNKSNIFPTIATITSTVVLDRNLKGAHLSRISEVINDSLINKNISLGDINDITKEVAERSETKGANLILSFDLINKRLTPVSKKDSYLSSKITIISDIFDKSVSNKLIVETVGTMLCPCSKAISKYGAHNQICNLKVSLTGNIESIDVEKIIDIMEQQFSSPVYSTVKREDEKYITEKAYENPKFSEDLIRDTIIAIHNYYSACDIRVELVNNESIHQHNVYAMGEQNADFNS